MAASALIEYLVFGITISSLYALVAIGFTLIFSIRGIANLAHGALLMAGGYSVFLLVSSGVPVTLALLITIPIGFLIAVVLYRGMVKPIENQPLTAMMVTLLIAFLAEEFVRNFISDSTRTVPPIIEGVTAIAGTPITYNRILAFVVSVVLVVGVWYFVTRTYTGQAILAVSIDEKGAASAGINIDRTNLLVWGIAGALAVVAGYFWGSLNTLAPGMGLDPLLSAFVIVVIGGLGSVSGSVLAAYIIGLLETSAAFLIDPGAQGLFSFGVLILVLLFRPQGLFGNRSLEFD
ncbi:branched-chain amino acid ABC transporter permease [Halorarius litoreus]|uniref:branched-chain amino acid ABC transporter permease n=1 Tax=Halorarius litoreus TaxID=2962676 RepID=UPI0020CD082A|nr:branched-chain amino acid ABC transporter permease [Halorarius litoreus]